MHVISFTYILVAFFLNYILFENVSGSVTTFNGFDTQYTLKYLIKTAVREYAVRSIFFTFYDKW